MLVVPSKNSFFRKFLWPDWLGSNVAPIFFGICSSAMRLTLLSVLHGAWSWISEPSCPKKGELSPAFVISKALRIWEGPYNCRGCTDLVYPSHEDLQAPFLLEFLKGEGEYTIVCPTSLLGDSPLPHRQLVPLKSQWSRRHLQLRTWKIPYCLQKKVLASLIQMTPCW
jgi:hypothetical protein